MQSAIISVNGVLLTGFDDFELNNLSFRSCGVDA